MADVVDDPVLVLEGLGRLAVRPLVDEADLEALVEEGHHLQALDDRLGPELDLLEDGRVRPEGDRGPGPAPGRRAGDLELAGRLAAVDELHDVVVAVAVDLEHQPGGQGVDHRDPDAVQAAGDLVAATLAELPAGVEHGQDHLGGRLPLVLLHRAGRDPPAVVDHPDPAVGQQGHVDLRAVAGHGLVHRVVDDLPHQVVQAGRAGRSDVHPRPLPDRVQTLQNGDVARRCRWLPPRSARPRFSAPQARPFQHRLTEREPAQRGCPRRVRALPRTTAIPRFQCSSVAPGVPSPDRWSGPRAAGFSDGPGPPAGRVERPRPRRPPGRAVRPRAGGPGWPRPGGRRSPPGPRRRAGPAARGRPWPRPRSRPTGRTAARAPRVLQPQPPRHRLERGVERAGPGSRSSRPGPTTRPRPRPRRTCPPASTA